MKTVFADTVYWVALIIPGDPWADSASRAIQNEDVFIVTTDEVLTETINAINRGEYFRELGSQMVRTIMKNPNIRVAPQTRESFLIGLELYEKRKDKDYSLTDCISINTMRKMGLMEILSNDHHFEQEGFILLNG